MRAVGKDLALPDGQLPLHLVDEQRGRGESLASMRGRDGHRQRAVPDRELPETVRDSDRLDLGPGCDVSGDASEHGARGGMCDVLDAIDRASTVVIAHHPRERHHRTGRGSPDGVGVGPGIDRIGGDLSDDDETRRRVDPSDVLAVGRRVVGQRGLGDHSLSVGGCQTGPIMAQNQAEPTHGPARDVPRVGVIIPAGGTARRLGGMDKPALDVGGCSILERLIAELRPLPVVVVGPRPEGSTWPGAVWCREDPPGGGPAAALAAGLRALGACDVVVAVAGDQPFAASAVPRLVRALLDDDDVDAALGIDPGHRLQPLLAAYRSGPLRERLTGRVDGLSMRQVTATLRVVLVPLSGPETIDVDDESDLARARAAGDASARVSRCVLD